LESTKDESVVERLLGEPKTAHRMRDPGRDRVPREVFISHAHQDRTFVAKVIKLLQRHRIHYWYSPKHIVGAQQWHDEIGKALERCDWFLLVLTPHAVKSKWVGPECMYSVKR
jgi:hypothetical protein